MDVSPNPKPPISEDMSPDSCPAVTGDRSPAGKSFPGEIEAKHNNKNAKVSVGNDGGRQDEEICAQNGVVIQSRSGRPTRACTVRTSARLQQQLGQVERKAKATPNKELEEPPSPPQQYGCRLVTPLVEPPQASLLPRWNLRCMWELASVLNFLHVFRPLLNISAEFSAEEFETALITPNDTLGEIHIPLLKAIPPNTRSALTRDTWVTALCRKLRDWWHWVAEGELPIVASRGAEIETYKSLDPSVRVVILKALCDIRVEQEDIRSYIDGSLKQGVKLSEFRKQRVGGDSYGVHYWYEDDSILGHRLCREIRKVDVQRAKARGSQVTPTATYEWETVATNYHEFEDVSEKLFSSCNRSEASLGKKLKIDILPEIEKVHKRKERLLKKQHREVLLLDNFISLDGFGPGRARRDRKPVTYTFDDYDRSINEAIKITKRRQSSPEPNPRKGLEKPDISTNGNSSEPLHLDADFTAVSPPNSPHIDDANDEEHNLEQLDHRQRKRPQRYLDKDFVEAVSDADIDNDSDEDIVGEAVYDEEYLKKRKKRKLSSESEEEYHIEEENVGEEYEEEEDSLGMSEEDSPKLKKLRGQTKLRSVNEIATGSRRSRRATRNLTNYRKYEFSDSETEPKPNKGGLPSSESQDYSNGSAANNNNDDDYEADVELKPGQIRQDKEPKEEGGKRGFVDLNINEVYPSNTVVKDEGTHDD